MDVSKEKQKFWTNKKNYKNLVEIIPLKTPPNLLIEPTNRCTFRCIFCPTGDKNLLKEVGRPLGDMSLELFKKIVCDLQTFPDKLERIHLYKDGEPLLNPKLPEMIKHLKEADVCNEVSTTTNVSLLTEELAIKLIESGLDSIRISVESMSNEGYRKLTRSKCDFDEVKQKVELLDNVKRDLRCKNPSIFTKIIDFNLTDQEKKNFYEEFSKISDEIDIIIPVNWNGSHRKDFTLGQKNYAVKDKKNLLQQREVCPRPWYTMAINFNGQVSICCIDWSNKTIIGNVVNKN